MTLAYYENMDTGERTTIQSVAVGWYSSGATVKCVSDNGRTLLWVH